MLFRTVRYTAYREGLTEYNNVTLCHDLVNSNTITRGQKNFNRIKEGGNKVRGKKLAEKRRKERKRIGRKKGRKK